jgi:hypothetical protein
MSSKKSLLRLLKEHNLKASKRTNHFKKIPPERGGRVGSGMAMPSAPE